MVDLGGGKGNEMVLAAKRFFRKLLKGQGRVPGRLVTDKLRSYGAAHRKVMPSVIHSTDQYENNKGRGLT